jgi:O-antigen/teichoic acid export membrane protein
MKRLLKTVEAYQGFVIAVLAQGLQYGSGLLLLPVVVYKLGPSEVGLWYLFIAAQGLAAVADFGFQPTIARYVSLAHAGASRFDEDLTLAGKPAGPNLPLLANMLNAARKLYAVLAACMFSALVIGGVFYILPLARDGGLDTGPVLTSWFLFAAATALSIYFLWIPAFLLGSGKVAQNYIFLVLSRGSSALLGIIALLMGFGLIGLSAAFLVAQIIARLGGHFAMSELAVKPGAPSDPSQVSALLRELAPNAARLGLVGLGAFLITRFNVFAVSSFFGLAAAASFSISLQMLMAVNTIAQLPAQMSLARLVNARVSKDVASLRKISGRAVGAFLLIAIAGSAATVVLAPRLLNVLDSSVEPLPLGAMLLLAVVMILEANHSVHAFLITTANQVPFVLPALLSGGAVVVLVPMSCLAGFGILGVIAAQGLVQAAYNNWHWPYVFWKSVTR